MTLLRLLIRRHRRTILLWWVAVVALIIATGSAYQSTYPTAEQRQIAVALSRRNGATTALYGVLPGSGNPAQMFAWEMGAILTILVAVMAVLMAVTLVRVPEDDGTLELVRITGMRASTPLTATVGLLLMVAVALAVGCVAALAPRLNSVLGVNWPGIVSFGAVVGLTFLLTAMISVVIAQLAATAGGARLLGFAVLGVSFALRAVGDTGQISWLGWLSPLGLRAVVLPLTENRWPPVIVALFCCFAFGLVAWWLSRSRDVGAGLIRVHDRGAARLHIRSTLGLTVRLARGSVLAWTFALGCLGSLLASMGSSVVPMSEDGNLGDGFLASQLEAGDPVAGYFGYTGTFLGIVISIFSIATVLRARSAELQTRTDLVLATGARRWAPLGAQLAVAAGGTLIALLVTGGMVALIAPSVISGSQVAGRGFFYILGQWPAALALAGLTVAVVGLIPSQSWLAWLPLFASAGLALLGALVGVPAGIREMGVFQHTPDIAAEHPELVPMFILIGVGGIAAAIGLAAMANRDILTS